MHRIARQPDRCPPQLACTLSSVNPIYRDSSLGRASLGMNDTGIPNLQICNTLVLADGKRRGKEGYVARVMTDLETEE